MSHPYGQPDQPGPYGQPVSAPPTYAPPTYAPPTYGQPPTGPAGHPQTAYPQAVSAPPGYAPSPPPAYAPPGYAPPGYAPPGYAPQPGYPHQAYAPPAAPQPVSTPPGYGQRPIAPAYPPAPASPGYPPAGYGPPQSATTPVTAAPRCRQCGWVPAAPVTFRGHKGMVVVMQFLKREGPFCRRCGLATFRKMTSDTMWQGWWGYGSSIITPITVLINLVRRGKVAALPEPQPFPHGPNGTPADPGAPLLARPGTIVGLIVPAVMLTVFVIAVTVTSTGG